MNRWPALQRDEVRSNVFPRGYNNGLNVISSLSMLKFWAGMQL